MNTARQTCEKCAHAVMRRCTVCGLHGGAAAGQRRDGRGVFGAPPAVTAVGGTRCCVRRCRRTPIFSSASPARPTGLGVVDPHIVGCRTAAIRGPTVDRHGLRQRDRPGRGDGPAVPGWDGARRVLAVVAAVGAALDHAHHRGLLHRDVKPGNIMISHPDDGSPAANFVVRLRYCPARR